MTDTITVEFTVREARALASVANLWASVLAPFAEGEDVECDGEPHALPMGALKIDLALMLAGAER
jgi:hypothetical protein